MTSSHAAQISLWLKVLHTLLVGVVVVVYAIKYKPTNFLWFSDIALVTSVPAMWLENSLLASAMAVAVLLPELAWNVDFFSRLLFGSGILGLSDYMFESRRPLYLRSLSLFHVARASPRVRSAGAGGADRFSLGRPDDDLSPD